MSGHDAAPGDLYIDQQQAVWRVVGVFGEPSVMLERVDDKSNRMHLGVSGQTWFDLTRIWRRGE